MPTPLRLCLSATTAHPRHAVVSELTEVLNELGWVLDFHQYSSVSLTVDFELPVANAPRLYRALAALPLVLSAESLQPLLELESATLVSVEENLVGSLQVTFFHSEPDLRIPVPAVPG